MTVNSVAQVYLRDRRFALMTTVRIVLMVVAVFGAKQIVLPGSGLEIPLIALVPMCFSLCSALTLPENLAWLSTNRQARLRCLRAATLLIPDTLILLGLGLSLHASERSLGVVSAGILTQSLVLYGALWSPAHAWLVALIPGSAMLIHFEWLHLPLYECVSWAISIPSYFCATLLYVLAFQPGGENRL